jgi:2-keto-4-pentenoate hydratase/2-oxohepta-3-ene-1,7-dioic acid hydratase in catechol pathway
LDYEVELAIVIGKPCKNVSKEEVFDYIAGYMAFNDISARDVVRRENGVGIFLMGKNFPGFSPMGPFLVLKDEVVDART